MMAVMLVREQAEGFLSCSVFAFFFARLISAAIILGNYEPGAAPDGRFMVRPRPGSNRDWVLSVTYRGKPTHHLITVRDDE
jgi:hypothetical protein